VYLDKFFLGCIIYPIVRKPIDGYTVYKEAFMKFIPYKDWFTKFKSFSEKANVKADDKKLGHDPFENKHFEKSASQGVMPHGSLELEHMIVG
jgi:hypothetical protein